MVFIGNLAKKAMNYGYLRVSTAHQVLDNQKNEISNFAASKNITIDTWIVEVVSGTKKEKDRKLGSLLKKLQKGDVLIITEISRLSRSLTEVMSIMGKILDKQVTLYSTKDKYTFDNSINSKVLCFAFGLVAEIERNLISARTREALALRRANGIKLGRPYGTTLKMNILEDNENIIRDMRHNGSSIQEICETYGISRTTYYRYFNL